MTTENNQTIVGLPRLFNHSSPCSVSVRGTELVWKGADDPKALKLATKDMTFAYCDEGTAGGVTHLNYLETKTFQSEWAKVTSNASILNFIKYASDDSFVEGHVLLRLLGLNAGIFKLLFHRWKASGCAILTGAGNSTTNFRYK